jgi:hypothetical protein
MKELLAAIALLRLSTSDLAHDMRVTMAPTALAFIVGMALAMVVTIIWLAHAVSLMAAFA